MGGAILTLVSRVKKLERTVKQLRTARLVGDAPATEGDVDTQDAVDLEGLSRMASEAMGHNPATVLSEDIEHSQEEEFHAPFFDCSSSADISESAGPSVGADKGKAPMPDLEIPAEFLAEDAQARQRLEEEQASARLVQQLQAEDLAQADVPPVSEQLGTNPALARELLGADVTEDNFIERMTAIKERKKRALADLRYRALKGKPLKQSEVTKMMRNLVKNQWCAAHNGTITMKAVTAMSKQQLTEEYENICRRLEKDRLLSAQYNLFRPKPAITEPPSKRQRVERTSSQPSVVPAATTHPADDPDSAGGRSFHPAGSTPMSGSAVPETAGGPLDTTGTASNIPTSAAMDSAASHHELGISPFADSDDSSSPSPVSTDHVPIDVLVEPTQGGIHAFFLDSDEDEQIGLSRVAAEPDSDDEVLAEILFRGQYVSAAGVVVVDKLPDDEIVDPRVKVEPISESPSSPPRSRSKHRGVRSDTSLWDRPVDDFLSSESESDDDIEEYIPPIPYGAFKDWEIVRCPLRNTYYHVYYQENRRGYFGQPRCRMWGLDLWTRRQSVVSVLHSDDVEVFGGHKRMGVSRLEVISQELCSCTGLNEWEDCVYVCGTSFIRSGLHCWKDVTPTGSQFHPHTVGMLWLLEVYSERSRCLREYYEWLASVLCYQNLDGIHFPYSCWDEKWLVQEQTALGAKGLTSPEQTATGKGISNPLMAVMVCQKPYGIQLTNVSIWKLLLRDVAVSFDSAVHRDHADSLDTVAFSLFLTACCTACWLLCILCCFVPVLFNPLALKKIYLRNLELTESTPSLGEDFIPADSLNSIPADYVSAGLVLVPADSDRIC
ncbi:hypothetical protein Tco_0284975 [Tanacetum coccineum]